MLSLFDYMYSVANRCNNKLIGDLNFPTIDWNLLQGGTSLSNSFCDLIFNLNLTQLVDKSTQNCGNIVDLVITNIEDNISLLLIHSADFIPFKSDHFPITFSLNTQSSLLLNKTSSYYMFNYSKGDYVGLCNHLTNIDFFPC